MERLVAASNTDGVVEYCLQTRNVITKFKDTGSVRSPSSVSLIGGHPAHLLACSVQEKPILHYYHLSPMRPYAPSEGGWTTKRQRTGAKKCGGGVSSGVREGSEGSTMTVGDFEGVAFRQTLPEVLSAVSFSSDAQILFGGGVSGRLYVWHLSWGSLLKTVSRHYSRVTCVKLTSDESTLVTASEDGTLCAYGVKSLVDIRESNPAPYRRWIGHSMGITGICFSMDARMLRGLVVSGSQDKTVKVWSLSSDCSISMALMPSRVNCVVLSHGHDELLVCCDEGKIYVVMMTQRGIIAPPLTYLPPRSRIRCSEGVVATTAHPGSACSSSVPTSSVEVASLQMSPASTTESPAVSPLPESATTDALAAHRDNPNDKRAGAGMLMGAEETTGVQKRNVVEITEEGDGRGVKQGKAYREGEGSAIVPRHVCHERNCKTSLASVECAKTPSAIIGVYSGHRGRVHCCTLSLDSAVLYSAAEDGVRIWNTRTRLTVTSLNMGPSVRALWLTQSYEAADLLWKSAAVSRSKGGRGADGGGPYGRAAAGRLLETGGEEIEALRVVSAVKEGIGGTPPIEFRQLSRYLMDRREDVSFATFTNAQVGQAGLDEGSKLKPEIMSASGLALSVFRRGRRRIPMEDKSAWVKEHMMTQISALKEQRTRMATVVRDLLRAINKADPALFRKLDGGTGDCLAICHHSQEPSKASAKQKRNAPGTGVVKLTNGRTCEVVPDGFFGNREVTEQHTHRRGRQGQGKSSDASCSFHRQ
eukprot:GHVQ01018091.1.p1 GENE.GHVQ01018091.1~~GHVQ01018091.1.p1  ORF type:complete len:759 (-),score=105.86 GHVQ01018091.1:1336-3612(-)